MFTGISTVSNTSIFARLEGVQQYLVYQMSYSAAHELAMVLPIPVPAGSPEDAVSFISFYDYGYFFDDMLRGFPTRGSTLSLDLEGSVAAAAALEVHDVGDYEASFVPGISEFGRLDPRFRFSDAIWNQLPQYHDYGFAVFKLKSTANSTDVHPIAFKFPTRLTDSVYFPTLHIHDGSLPSKAKFDHMLFCQAPPDYEPSLGDWHRSFDVASEFIDIPASLGVVDPNRFCWQKGLNGMLVNEDTIIASE